MNRPKHYKDVYITILSCQRLAIDVLGRRGCLEGRGERRGSRAVGRCFAAQFAATFPLSQRILLLGLLAATVGALIHGAVDKFYFVPDLALFFGGALAVSGALANTAQA